MTTERQAVAAQLRAAEDALGVLATALWRAGIRLPSVDMTAGTALVSLGQCSAPVARQLAAVIERGAER